MLRSTAETSKDKESARPDNRKAKERFFEGVARLVEKSVFMAKWG